MQDALDVIDKPPAGTGCVVCKAAGHFCAAVKYLGDTETGACQPCIDGEDCERMDLIVEPVISMEISREPESVAGPVMKPIYTPPLKNAKDLVGVLSNVMQGMLAGRIDVSTANAACKISSETIKAMDLIWRMSNRR